MVAVARVHQRRQDSGLHVAERLAPGRDLSRRLGNSEEFGAACAFLCGDASGYLTGQNLQLDGGAYEGLL